MASGGYRQAAWGTLPPQKYHPRIGLVSYLPVIVPMRFLLRDQETGELEPDPDPEWD